MTRTLSFPNDVTCIERVPWQGPEPGAPGWHKPHWRLMVWRRTGAEVNLVRVITSERIADLLKLTDWRVSWFATVIAKAHTALGRRMTDMSKSTFKNEPECKLRVYEDHIVAKRVDGVLEKYNMGKGVWEVVS